MSVQNLYSIWKSTIQVFPFSTPPPAVLPLRLLSCLHQSPQARRNRKPGLAQSQAQQLVSTRLDLCQFCL